MKEQRWYETHGEMVIIYNAPRPEIASACSIVGREDMNYYRNNFELSKIWKKEI